MDKVTAVCFIGLLYADEPLDDAKTVADYNIESGSVLKLAVPMGFDMFLNVNDLYQKFLVDENGADFVKNMNICASKLTTKSMELAIENVMTKLKKEKKSVLDENTNLKERLRRMEEHHKKEENKDLKEENTKLKNEVTSKEKVIENLKREARCHRVQVENLYKKLGDSKKDVENIKRSRDNYRKERQKASGLEEELKATRENLASVLQKTGKVYSMLGVNDQARDFLLTTAKEAREKNKISKAQNLALESSEDDNEPISSDEEEKQDS
ncbi:OLC1v1000361C1 [Oldenlandia corymbosa var. corymbosa]|uniref:OLC1v1000361C1 n=1 Tax=Oldenlandia corymbosa var. corymbosa TaxID=529605 RepID=A0AAV1D336_OLDCO|nr:OLC1v1000361C1 [Oldenlandia corymbosa var. corymbosa]